MYRKEHGPRRSTGLLLAEAQQNRRHDHADAQADTAIEHRLLPAHFVQSEGGTEAADYEHELDAGGRISMWWLCGCWGREGWKAYKPAMI